VIASLEYKNFPEIVFFVNEKYALKSFEFSSSQSDVQWKRIKSWRQPVWLLHCCWHMNWLLFIVSCMIDY